MGYTEVGPPWRGSAEEGWAAVKLLDGGRLGADLLLEGETGSGRRERWFDDVSSSGLLK